MEPIDLRARVLDDQPGRHPAEHELSPTVFGRGHIMHYAEGCDDASEHFVHVDGDKGDREGDDELARRERKTGPEFAQNGVDDEDQEKEGHKHTHRDGAFDERGGA